MPARLTILPARRAPRRWWLHEDRVYELGRDEACELVVEDDRVSRRHARFRHRGAAWRVADLDSKNGLAVDGSPARDAALASGSLLSFGGVVGTFELLDEDAARRELEDRRRRRASSLDHPPRLDPQAGLEATLEQVLASVLEIAGAERAFVLLDGPQGLEVTAAAGLDGPELRRPEFAGSVGAVESVLAERTPIAVGETGGHPLLAGRDSVRGRGIRALVCVPLLAPGGLRGVIYADSRSPGAIFDALDVELLEAYAGRAAVALELARLGGELGRLTEGIAATATPRPASVAGWSDVVAAHSGAGP